MMRFELCVFGHFGCGEEKEEVGRRLIYTIGCRVQERVEGKADLDQAQTEEERKRRKRRKKRR